MSLRQVVVWVGFLFVPFFSNGQGKKRFNLPESITTGDFESGQVWVKLKQANKYALEGHNGGRFSPKVEALSIEPFLTKHSRSNPKGRVSPRKQLVDISLYYKLKYEKTKNVEEYINDLYATGLFEIVEPVYTARPQLVPNDPSFSQQYYIDLIKAPQAWDLVDVDESIVIGIVDTGGDLDHPDLQPNLFIDPAEPIDGIDNDNDGYVDNNRGWDFSGSTLAQIGTPGFKGDNDPSINQGGLFSHGTMVAGCASASTNNGIGIAGVGFSAKLMFTKHYADDQAPGDYSSNLYDGILYAATHGAKIINCSWGSYNPSTIAQDIITYVTHDLNCVVVAAAGNSNLETPIYPASYDYVVSVAYSSSSDVRSAYSNYGKTIDIIAPGEGIYTTSYNDGYGSDSGTSLATPMVSGTAALVWSKFPTLNALQVAEQIRVSADESVYANNPAYLYKLGKGRLDVERALTIQTPSIRASNQLLVKGNGSTPDPGDVASLYFDFTNYLETSSGALKVTLTSSSPYITVDQPVFDLGSMTANTTIRNTSSPFVVTISETLPLDSPIEALLTFEDGDYKDFQLVNISVPSYIDVNENNIITSITPAGRIGFGNTELQSNGSGFIYNEESILYEMGLIMGTSAGDIDNNLRTTVGAYDQDFSPSSKITKHTPGERSYSEITGGFINAADASSATLSVEYTSLVWKNDPYRNFVILEYKIRNTSAAPINNFHFGIFADWDISNGGAADRASWDDDTRLGYVYGAQGTGKPHAGIQVLSGNEHYNAIDNDPAIAGNPFGIYDGFTDNEKFTIISNGLARLEAGNATTGNDVSHAVASGPYSINSGDEITVAFAIHAALTKDELIKSAKYADSLYNYTFNAPRPVVEAVAACYGSEATVTASGAASFNWYKEPTGGSPFFTGSQFVTSSIFNDTVFFVSNADHPFESIRTPATIEVKPLPEIEVSGDVEFCEGTTVTLTASQADAYNWSSGETTRAIEVGSAGNYSVATNNNGSECKSAEAVTVIVFPQPSSTFTVSPENPEAGKSVSFSNTGGGGTSWNWEFGDGDVSTEQNPVHVYDELGDYTVTLTTSSAAGCESTSSTLIGIITGVEQRAGQSFTIYPNPVSDNKVIVRFTSRQGDLDVSMFNAQGTIVYFSKVDNDLLSVDVSHFADGIYMMMFRTPVETFAKKIIVRR